MPAIFTNKLFIGFLFILFFVGVGVGAYKYANSEVVVTSDNFHKEENKKSTVHAKTNDDTEYEGIKELSEEEMAKLKAKEDAEKKKMVANSKTPNKPDDKTKPFNILVLGIDKRYGEQKHWRTDVIQLITLSPDRTKAVITHIPRDVWAGSYKINAVYNLKGPEAMKDEIQKITGQRPDRIIRTDFDAFVWAVDAVNGVTVNVPRAFVDKSYPNDRAGKSNTITVEFKAGTQVMDGERALQYVRSRKGTNGEGSDYARGTRQQQVMRAWVKDFFKPDNLFNPKTAKVLYNLATQKIYTDFTLADTEVLFDVMKNYNNISVKQISLDTSNYLTVPVDRSNYGGAWTLIPKDGNYNAVHEEIETLLN